METNRVSRTGKEQRDHAERAASGPGRRHPRHRLPALRRAAAGPGRHHPGAGLAQPAVRVRHRPRRQGQDHPGHRVRAHVRARGGQLHLAGHARRPGGLLRHLRVPAPRPRHDRLRRGPGSRAGVPGPAQPRPAAVLLPAVAPVRLPGGQTRGVRPGLPGPAGRPVAAAPPGPRHPGPQRRGGRGPDPAARPRPAGGAGLGRAAGLDRARARLIERAPRLRDRQHRDLLLPQLGPGRPAERGDVRERGGGRRGGAALRPGQPLHRARRAAPVARRHLAGAEPAAGELRAAVRRDVPADAGGRGGRAGRPVPEGGRGMSTIELRNVSRWYGDVVAINDITMTIGPGVTGLLGPNGAGKSTLLHLISGFLEPSRGELTVGGAPSWRNPGIYQTLGLVPERPAVYPFLTGLELVRATAGRAIAIVEMPGSQDRKIATYSKGMRQRIKVAAALVHDPETLLLDEPFNGMDPRQRLHMMDLLETLGDDGRTILFSSHILEEVERLSGTIQVIVAGRLAASGDFRAIRRLMTSRPHVFQVRTSDDRRLGAALIGRPSVTGVEMSGNGLQVKASDYGAFSREIAALTREQGIQLRELLPEDESLESVFAYLVEQ